MFARHGGGMTEADESGANLAWVAAAAKPEGKEFVRFVSWITFGRVVPRA
jgi:hypothetical protein